MTLEIKHDLVVRSPDCDDVYISYSFSFHPLIPSVSCKADGVHGSKIKHIADALIAW